MIYSISDCSAVSIFHHEATVLFLALGKQIHSVLVGFFLDIGVIVWQVKPK